MLKTPLDLTVLFLTASLLLQTSDCQTLRQIQQPFTKGNDVVDAVLKVLADSCLYRDDAEFLRRLANVESNDGNDYMTFRQGYDGGIWQVDKDKFELTKTEAAKLSGEYNILGTKFGINWSRVIWSDLLKPLHSGIAAALYTKLLTNASAIPGDIYQQAQLWETHYRPGKNVTTFSDSATSQEQNCEPSVLLDILFAVDTSHAMTDAQWIQVKDYIKAKVIKIAQEKEPGSEGHRVAMMTYSTGALLAFLFENTTNLKSVLAEIDLAPRLGYSPNLTSAIIMAHSLIFPTSRQQATKVMVILTHSKPDNGISALQESTKLKSQGVIVRTIGIGPSVQQAGLDSIASLPTCSYSTNLSTYADLGLDDFRYYQRDCRGTIQLTPGVYTYPCSHNFLGKLPTNGAGYSITMSLSDGEADLLASISNPVPTQTQNELSLRVTSSQPIFYPSNNTHPLSIKINTDRLASGQNGSRSCMGNFTLKLDYLGSKTQKCNGKNMDLLILFDSTVASNHVTFKQLVSFIIQHVSQFDIKTIKNRVGVAVFDASSVHSLMWLKDTISLPELLTTLRQLTPPGSSTAASGNPVTLSPALQWARQVGFSIQHGGRADSSKSIILFTTGNPSAADATAAKNQGQLAQKEGIRVVIVALDKTFDTPTLTAITSSSLRVINVTDITQIGINLQTLYNATCGSVSVKCVEQNVVRDCSPDDLINSQYGQIVVGDRNLTDNPCILPPIAGLPPITRFPHPTKKDRFLMCDRKHQAYVVLCPLAEIYNPTSKECETTLNNITPPPASTGKQPLIVVLSSTKAPTTTVPTTTRPTTPTTTPPPLTDKEILDRKCTYNNILAGYRTHEDPRDRSKYITCSLTLGDGKVVSCPGGRWWVQATFSCEFVCPIVDKNAGQVDCSVRNPCDGPLVYYPHTTDHTKYIQCSPGKQAFIIPCPPNQVFKEKILRCDY